jgi:hypothetical protein
MQLQLKPEVAKGNMAGILEASDRGYYNNPSEG